MLAYLSTKSFVYLILCPWVLFVKLTSVQAQERRDFDWQIGTYSSGIGNKISMNVLFGKTGIELNLFNRPMGMSHFNASISDTNGRLLLYSNGCQVNTGPHLSVENSEQLNPGELYDEWCFDNYGYSVAEGGIFLPFYCDSIIFLVHQRKIIEGPPLQVYIDSLYYTSLRRHEGNYRILEKRRRIVGDFLTDGNVEAVKSSKPGAWWVMQSKDNSNEYYSIHLDSARVDTILTYAIGDTAIDGSAGGQSTFSPDGTMYARYAPRDDLFLFDFDRQTGLLSNYRKVHVADSGLVGGLAFSPNSRFLYVSAHVDLYQVDTWEADVEASKVHIGHYDGYLDPFPTTFYHMQLGPDCRIYMNSNNGNRSWHLIHEPDKKGPDCGFEQHGFHFPVSNSITMPNFPNYRLDVGPVCDPGLVTAVAEIPGLTTKDDLLVYPNPAADVVYIRLPDVITEGSYVTIHVSDMSGRICQTRSVIKVKDDTGMGLEHLPEGLYIIQVHTDTWSSNGKIVKGAKR